MPLSWVCRCHCLLLLVIAISLSLLSLSCLLLLPIIHGLRALHSHPVNSCSQWWLGVQCWWWRWWPSSSLPSPGHCGCHTIGCAGSLPVLPLLSSSPLLWSLLVCPFPPLTMLLPISTPWAVACSGGWPLLSCPSTHDPPCEQRWAVAVGVVVSPPYSHCAPRFHPASSCSRWQLGALSWCQIVPALCCPVVHPASRGSQQQCWCRVLSRIL